MTKPTNDRFEEGEEVQCKDIGNIFNKIIEGNFPNLEKEMPILVQKTSRTPKRHDQNRTSPQHITVKILSAENQQRILRSTREKSKVIYNSKAIRIAADFSTETLKASRAQNEVF
jgi:hypothetical protein